jgi:hypothetical protein
MSFLPTPNKPVTISHDRNLSYQTPEIHATHPRNSGYFWTNVRSFLNVNDFNQRGTPNDRYHSAPSMRMRKPWLIKNTLDLRRV